jgi:hypothetical protein
LQDTNVTSFPKSALVLCAILLAAAGFKLTFAPPLLAGPYVLRMSPIIHQSVANAIASHQWKALLLPFPYEYPRTFWMPTTIFFTYFVENTLGEYGSYIFWSSLFIVTSFVCTLFCSRSMVLAATVAFMFAFGTQLNYAYTYGTVVDCYLILSYITINATVAYLYISDRLNSPSAIVGFVLSLIITALSSEVWINYATALLTATFFGSLWSYHQGRVQTKTRATTLFCATLLVLVAYLVIRLRLASEFLRPGSEEELIVTYSSMLLIVDDTIANLFTYLYTVLDNYLPSFISSSNSLTYLSDDYILAAQNGYDSQREYLILMNHLFLWRFYAGVAATAFAGFTVFVLVRAWRTGSTRAAMLSALCLMVFTSFTTHLSIKMRPYNAVPALPYKAIVSVSVFTVLLGYGLTLLLPRLRSGLPRFGAVAAVWGCVVLAALTRPSMQDRMLGEVGLVGLSDPLGQIMLWLR